MNPRTVEGGGGFWSILPALLTACASPLCLPAGEPDPGASTDKSRFSLLRPVPESMLRDLATDRPDKTETPFTVDAGHFQVEMDLVTYTRDRHNSEKTNVRLDRWTAGPVNLKLGLLNQLDAELVLEPYIHERVRDESVSPALTDQRSGFGDTTFRLKANLWGNDGGRTALSLLPQIRFPTSEAGLGSDAVEGGLLIPLEIELPREMTLGINSGFNVVHSETDNDRHAEFVQSLALGYTITQRITGYIEFWNLVSTERDSDWQGYFDFGFNYLITPNLKLDAGLNIGVTRAADDWNPFLGLSWRY